MSLDEIVEAFVTTIIAVIFLVILVTIWNQDIGMVLVDFLPQFVEIAVWLLFVGIILALLLQFVEEF